MFNGKCKINTFVVVVVFILIFSNSYSHSLQNGKESPEHKNSSHEKALEETSNLEVIPAEPSGSSQKEANFPDPNTIPYKTDKSLLSHFLSIPAMAWHILWTPLGETVIWVEQNRIPQKVNDFFYLNKDRTAAIFPAISLGGNTGVGAGINMFHNNLFGKGKRIGLNALYSTSENNTASIVYQDLSLFGSSFYFDITGSYFNDSDENLYINPSITQEQMDDSSIDANNSELDDETSYATEEIGALANLGYAFSDKVGLGIVSSIRKADIEKGDGSGGTLFPLGIPGTGETKLFSIGGALTFNFAKGWPRVLSGPLLRLGYSYNSEIDGSRYAFNRFIVEANQFIPIPFMAENRRLAMRGLYERISRFGEKEIPFYELSTLGDAANLRGFDQNRFRGRGLLLFNLEYRYPVWDLWDAVVFVDEGQVFDHKNDITLDNFHTSVGTGIRFMSGTGFLMRFEVARSSEQWRALFQVTPNF